MNGQFHPSAGEAYAAFKRIRNKLRRYRPDHLIIKAMNLLRSFDSNKVESFTHYPPWHVLLLIKWTYLYGDWSSPSLRPLTVNDFNEIMNLFDDLHNATPVPPSLYYLLRTHAYQQFWLQEDYSVPRLARQSLLFGHLDKNHAFRRTFKAKTGLEVEQFLDLEIALMAKYVSLPDPIIYPRFFDSFQGNYTKEDVRAFFNTISCDIHSLHQLFISQKNRQGTDIQHEYFERTPLIKYPLAEIGGRFYLYCMHILFHRLENLIYDTLRDSDVSAFMDKFGTIFETYVRNRLLSCKYKFIDESELRIALGKKSKLVDFIIPQDGANIFIDAKGVEMAYTGMVSDNPLIIEQRTENSVIKGITQGYAVASRLREIGKVNKLLRPLRENYLLIVTFKELLLGNGAAFYGNVAKDKLDRIVADYGGSCFIPFENMYFISVDEFDLLLERTKGNRHGLVDMLRRAVKADSDPYLKAFMFKQHLLREPGGLRMPRHLIVEFHAIVNRCKLKIQQDSASSASKRSNGRIKLFIQKVRTFLAHLWKRSVH